jgi:hypothetical protein
LGGVRLQFEQYIVDLCCHAYFIFSVCSFRSS